MFCIAMKTASGEAETYKVSDLTFDLDWYEEQYSAASVNGYNVTHGFSRTLDCSLSSSSLYYALPNDGSTWEVYGTVYLFERGIGDPDGVKFKQFHETKTTTGTFNGVSIRNAVNAANSANTSASQAKTSADAAHIDAQNAANRTWYNGNESAYWAYYGKVRA